MQRITQTTVPATEFLDASFDGMTHRFLAKMLAVLERYTGTLYATEPSTYIQQASLLARKTFADLVHGGFLSRAHLRKHPYPDEPALISYTTYPPETDKPVGYGADFFSHERALWRAIGEGFERTIWRKAEPWRNTIRTGSYTQMGKDAIDIFAITGFSDAQRIAHPELRYTADTQFRWIPVRTLTTDTTAWCPAQLMSARYARAQSVNTPHSTTDMPEPTIRWTVSTGLATGTTRDDAIVAGVCEVIERDAFMITHLNMLTPEQWDITHLAEQNTQIRSLVEMFARHNLTLHIWHLPTDMPTSVILAAIVDETGVGPRITFGARASLDTAEAVINAITEAHSLRLGIRPSFRDVATDRQLDKSSRVAYWAQKTDLSGLAHLFAGTPVPHTLETPPPRSEWLPILKKTLRDAGMEAYVADLTGTDTKDIPLQVVNILIPSMQPLNLEERIRYQSGTRLTEVPKKLGLTPAPTPNTLPHPFS